MGWAFSPPTVDDGARFRTDADPVTRALFSHFQGPTRGRTVVRNGGTFVISDAPYLDDLLSADRVFHGGHVTPVSASEADALFDAGFTPVHSVTERADLWLDFAHLPASWVAADGVTNQGALGTDGDAVRDGDPKEVDATWVPGGVLCEAPTDPTSSNDERAFTVVGDLDFTGDFTVALDFTPTSVAPTVASIHYLDRKSGVLGSGGVGWALNDNTVFNGGNTAIIADGPDLGATVWPQATGRHLWVLRRSGGEMQLWIDGVTAAEPLSPPADPGDPVDVSAVGDVDSGIMRVGPGQTVHHVGVWPEALTASEITVDLTEAAA